MSAESKPVSAEHFVHEAVECHRCNSTTVVEVDITEEVWDAYRRAIEDAAKVLDSLGAHNTAERIRKLAEGK